MRRRRVQPGQPIDTAPSVLDGLIPPSVDQVLGELRAVAQIGATLHDMRKRQREGVIDLVEVAPGVFAAPRRPPPKPPGHLGRLQGLVDDFDQLARALHGRGREHR